MEFNLTLKGIKTPTDANLNNTLTDGYLNIKGRVYDIKKDRDANQKADGTLLNPKDDKYGYWKASAELTGLINPFTNPIDNKVVSETRIEVSFEDIYGWAEETTPKLHFEYMADSAKKMIESRYKNLFGVEISLTATALPEETNSGTSGDLVNGTSGSSGSTSGTNGTGGDNIRTITEVSSTSGTNGTNGTSGAGVSIDGEFTFNVEEENIFKPVNNQLGILRIIGVGEIKEEPLDIPEEEILDDEGLDEEYIEGDYVALEEGTTSYVSVQNIQNDASDKLNPARNANDILSPDILANNATIQTDIKFEGTPLGGSYKGKIQKETVDSNVLMDIMIGAIEGGYYHPTHFNPPNDAYVSSGETLWGIDRYAGTHENTLNGQKFWRIIDKISGYGDLSGGGSDFSNSHDWAKDTNGKVIKRLGSEGNPPYFKTSGVIKSGYVWGDISNEPYARVHKTSAWKFDKRPAKRTTNGKKQGGNNQAWGYLYSPNIKDYPEDYPNLRECAMTFCETTLTSNFKTYFSGYDELVSLIKNDGRLKFTWMRAAWNGVFYFKIYAKSVKQIWDAGVRNADELIVKDLNNRLVIAKGMGGHSAGLIKKDANIIAGVVGIK
jgi:hypothetical protein